MANFDWGKFLQGIGPAVGSISTALERQETLKRQRGIEDQLFQKRQQELEKERLRQEQEVQSQERMKQIQSYVAQGQPIPQELLASPEGMSYQKEAQGLTSGQLGIQEKQLGATKDIQDIEKERLRREQETQSQERMKQIQSYVVQGQPIPQELLVSPEGMSYQKEAQGLTSGRLGIQEKQLNTTKNIQEISEKDRINTIRQQSSQIMNTIQAHLEQNPDDYETAIKLITQSGLSGLSNDDKNAKNYIDFVTDRYDKKIATQIAQNKADREGTDISYKQFNAIETLANNIKGEVSNDKSAKLFSEVLSNFNIINDSWNKYQSGDKSKAAAAQQNIITAYMKILDPGSVVRESEFARIPGAESLIGRLKANYVRFNQIAAQAKSPTGLKITEGLMQELRDFAEVAAEARAKLYMEKMKGIYESKQQSSKLIDADLDMLFKGHLSIINAVPGIAERIGFNSDSQSFGAWISEEKEKEKERQRQKQASMKSKDGSLRFTD